MHAASWSVALTLGPVIAPAALAISMEDFMREPTA
jgi:hypothetical protein